MSMNVSQVCAPILFSTLLACGCQPLTLLLCSATTILISEDRQIHVQGKGWKEWVWYKIKTRGERRRRTERDREYVRGKGDGEISSSYV